MLQYLTRVFGSRSERIVRGYRSVAQQAGKFEQDLQGLSDEALGARTEEFRQRYKAGTSLASRAVSAPLSPGLTGRRTTRSSRARRLS